MSLFVKLKDQIIVTRGVIGGITPMVFDDLRDMGSSIGLLLPLTSTGFVVPEIKSGIQHKNIGSDGYTAITINRKGDIHAYYATVDTDVGEVMLVSVPVVPQLAYTSYSSEHGVDQQVNAFYELGLSAEEMVDELDKTTVFKRRYLNILNITDLPQLVEEAMNRYEEILCPTGQRLKSEPMAVMKAYHIS